MSNATGRTRPHMVKVYYTTGEMAKLREDAARQERTLDWTVRNRRQLVEFTPYELEVWESNSKKMGCSISEAVRRVMQNVLPEYKEPAPAPPSADVIPIRRGETP